MIYNQLPIGKRRFNNRKRTLGRERLQYISYYQWYKDGEKIAGFPSPADIVKHHYTSKLVHKTIAHRR